MTLELATKYLAGVILPWLRPVTLSVTVKYPANPMIYIIKANPLRCYGRNGTKLKESCGESYNGLIKNNNKNRITFWGDSLFYGCNR